MLEGTKVLKDILLVNELILTPCWYQNLSWIFCLLLSSICIYFFRHKHKVMAKNIKLFQNVLFCLWLSCRVSYISRDSLPSLSTFRSPCYTANTSKQWGHFVVGSHLLFVYLYIQHEKAYLVAFIVKYVYSLKYLLYAYIFLTH